MLERESPSVLYGGRGALEKLLGSILEGRKHQPKPFERAQCLPAILLSWLLHWEAGDNMAAIQAHCVCMCVLLHDASNRSMLDSLYLRQNLLLTVAEYLSKSFVICSFMHAV